MRRAFMNMFPVDGVSTAGTSGAGAQVQQQKDQPEVNKKEKKEVSVFSNYDKDKGKSVDYKEANANSLFAQKDFSNLAPSHMDAQIDDKGKAAIKKLAVSKFNPGAKFAEMLKGFNANTGMQKLEFDDGKVDQSTVNSTAKDLDKKAIDKAKAESDKANAKVFEQYSKALDDALKEYTLNNQAADGLGEVNDEDIKGKPNNGPKQFDKAAQTDTKTETKVYSQYDKNTDKSVNYGEYGDNFKQSNLENFAPAHMDQSNAKAMADVKRMAGNSFNAADAFKAQLSNFKSNPGMEKIKTDGDKPDQSKLQDAMKKLDTIVQKDAQKAQNKANEKVNKQYQKALDEAFKQYTLNGNQAPEPKPDAGDDKSKVGEGNTPVAKNPDGAGNTPSDSSQGTTNFKPGDSIPDNTNPSSLGAGTYNLEGGGTLTKGEDGSITVKKQDGDTTTTTTTKPKDGGGTTKTTTTEKNESLPDGGTRKTTTEDVDGDKKTTTVTKQDGTETTEVDNNGEKSINITHKVKQGQTCWGLAKTFTNAHEGFEVSAKDIMDQNNIKDPKKLQIGQELKIEMHKKKQA